MDTPCWKAKAKPEKEQRCRKYRALRPLCRANTIQPETTQGSLVHNAFHSFVLFYNSFVHTFHSIARFFDTLCTLFECSKSHCADHIALDRLNIQPSTANTQPHCFKSDLNEQAEKPPTKTKQNTPKKKVQQHATIEFESYEFALHWTFLEPLHTYSLSGEYTCKTMISNFFYFTLNLFRARLGAAHCKVFCLVHQRLSRSNFVSAFRLVSKNAISFLVNRFVALLLQRRHTLTASVVKFIA